jgi:Dullard-like phosphatase family protein
MNESNQNTLKYYLSPKDSSKKTLVLDLDETLVHSQFVPFSKKSDLVLKIDLENQIHDIHVMIRPGVNEFLKKMGKLYEIVIFTASVSKYADPLLDIIDKSHNCSHRLFREHCSMVGITYIKDLKKLGRDLKDIIIVDNSPLSYSFNPENGIPILTWFDDKNDKELYNLIPILEFLSGVYDVREFIKQIVINDSISYDNAIYVIENYSNQKHDNSNKKYIKEIIYNKKKYKCLDNKNGKENDKNRANYITNENNKIILNNAIEKKDNKNFVNITISNNEINNYLYFSPIYNINNTTTNIYPGPDLYDTDIEVNINPKIFQSKDNSTSHTRTNRTKSKDLLNGINNTKKKKVKNKSNDFKKINNIKKNNIKKK